MKKVEVGNLMTCQFIRTKMVFLFLKGWVVCITQAGIFSHDPGSSSCIVAMHSLEKFIDISINNDRGVHCKD